MSEILAFLALIPQLFKLYQAMGDAKFRGELSLAFETLKQANTTPEKEDAAEKIADSIDHS